MNDLLNAWPDNLKTHYLEDRVSQVDSDYLSFEEDMSLDSDKITLLKILENSKHLTGTLPNPYNSIILYITGLTNAFDFQKGRSDTIGGSPPDVDLDFDSIDRQKAIDWTIENWGRENVANIITHGTFGAKSVTDKFFSIHNPNPADFPSEQALENKLVERSRKKKEIKDKIPDPLFGVEPNLHEVIYGNEDKGYNPHPELLEPEYKNWYEITHALEGMVMNFGIHAAGLIISDSPVSDTIPVWYKEDKEMQENGTKKTVKKWITQWDMKESEELGSIKFDFLGINNLSIIKETCKLIAKRYGIEINPWEIPDGDERTYKMMQYGLLTGLFQMETSQSAKDLIQLMKPESIGEISVISAINRPGPLLAGVHEQYAENKELGQPPADMHPKVAEILKPTYWTLVYQEQVMAIVSDLAGFSLVESDDIRRAMGKKKKSILQAYESKFVAGCVNSGLTEVYASGLWEDLIGFSEYCFNASHSVCYSYITYACGWLKANYPVEFFCCLMGIRSRTMSPKAWSEKASEYIAEAKAIGVGVYPPSLNSSGMDFEIQNNDIYFGLSAIRDFGRSPARHVVNVRGNQPFKSVKDFIERVSLQSVTTKKFKALVYSGCFDKMGYGRQQLIEAVLPIYEHMRTVLENKEREAENLLRERENVELIKIVERRRELKKIKNRKRDRDLTLEEEQFLIDTNGTRKKNPLKMKTVPEWPQLVRQKTNTLSVVQLMDQAKFIGCYIGAHPARTVYPNTCRISHLVVSKSPQELAGVLTKLRVIKDRNRNEMAFLEFGDGTGTVDGVIFARTFSKLKEIGLPELGDIVLCRTIVDEIDPQPKGRVLAVKTYKPE